MTGQIHSKYADGTPVYKHLRPSRLGEPIPDEEAKAPHCRLRWDYQNQRIYQAREFDQQGQPVRDIDFTSPTYPNGTLRPDHLLPPHQHFWVSNPTGGIPHRSQNPQPL